jgi:hypothetical protein
MWHVAEERRETQWQFNGSIYRGKFLTVTISAQGTLHPAQPPAAPPPPVDHHHPIFDRDNNTTESTRDNNNSPTTTTSANTSDTDGRCAAIIAVD